MFRTIYEWKQEVTSAPLRRMIAERPEKITDEYMLATLAVAVPTLLANTITPVLLIDAGKRGLPMHTGTYFGKMPWDTMYEYTTKASKATRAGTRVGGKLGGRIAGRLIPGIGWAMLAYDVYDVAVNRSLWGFELD